MSCKEVSPPIRRHLPDLAAGFAVFAVLIGLTGWHIGIATTANASSVGAILDRNASALLLAGAFSALAVFNVAFVRHLRRAYARPRRPTRRSAANRLQ